MRGNRIIIYRKRKFIGMSIHILENDEYARKGESLRGTAEVITNCIVEDACDARTRNVVDEE